MRPREILLFIALAFLIHSLIPASVQAESLHNGRIKSSPFSLALETLQKHINYKFERIHLLGRAMTHSSFSEENNKALSILGANVIDASVSLYSLTDDIDLSAKFLNRRIAEVSNVDKSCAVDGLHLGLQKIVRVSSKTNVTAPALLCASFRAIFGAIAIDKGSVDAAGKVFLAVHSGKAAVAMQCGSVKR